MIVLETEPAIARAAGRSALSLYLQLENYLSMWCRVGFTESDLAGSGSDRFVDAMVAWGDERAIRSRIEQHWDAGADHVCIQAIPSEGGSGTDEKALAAMAPTTGWFS